MGDYATQLVLPATPELGFRARLFVGAAVAGLAALAPSGPASATCTNFTPTNGETVTCDGVNTTGVIGTSSTDVTLTLLANGSIIPPSGYAISLGDSADISLQQNTTTGNAAINNYAIFVGNGASIALDGLIQGRGGITGPLLPSGLTGITGATITINSTGQIITNGTASNAAINGRGGSNTYIINGAIRATGISGQGIMVGTNDQLTLGATGSITTLSGDTSTAFGGSGATGVKVTTAPGSLIELHGIGRGIQLGANADVTLGGTIRSYGDAAVTNSAGGVGVEVGANSTVWLQEGAQIVTGNTAALGNQGSGGTGISTFTSSIAPNSTIIVDGLIDTQRALGIFAGIGDTITIGETGLIRTRGNSGRGIFVNARTTVADDTITIDVHGRVETLGNTNAIFISGSRATGEVVETAVRADVTIHEGGSIFAQNADVYDQDDGFGNFPEVIDNLIVAGSIVRGTPGRAIDLNDGADRITLMPTYAITGSIDGGNDAASLAETDTFVLDGAAATNATFNFGTNQLLNFEAGEKNGAGTWTLLGAAGTGLNGLFAVNAGTLIVNGSLASAGANVASGATLGGSGSIGGAVGITGGGILAGHSGSTFGLGSLLLADTSNINVALGAPSNTALFNIVGGLTLDGRLNIADGGGFGLGTYRLFDYGGTFADNGLVIWSVPADYNPGNWEVDTGTTGQVNLIVAAGPGEQYWDGINMTPGSVANGRGGSGTWNSSNTNWTNQAGTINAAWASERAVFAAAGASTVTVVGSQTFTGMRFLGNADYNFTAGTAGALTTNTVDTPITLEQAIGETTAATIRLAVGGSGGLLKNGDGTLVLTAANSYSGGTTIAAGTLQLGEGGATGSVAGNIANDGRLVFNRSDSPTFAGLISGSGEVVVDGAGIVFTTAHSYAGGTGILPGATLRLGNGDASGSVVGDIENGGTLIFERSDSVTFAGSVTGGGEIRQAGSGALLLTGNSAAFVGDTFVDIGTLAVDGSLGGDVTVQSGAVLEGTGSIGGLVSVLGGGTLEGVSGQQLTMGGLTMASGALLDVTLGTPSDAALFDVTGDLTLDGTLDIHDGGGFGLGVYRLIDYGGTLTDNGLLVGQVPVSAGDAELIVQTSQANQVNLVVSESEPDFVQFWNGTTTSPAGTVVGGEGSWTAGPVTNWTNANGTESDSWNGGFAVFQGAPGTVTIDNGSGAVSAQGLQFAVDGYVLAGGPLTLAEPGATPIRVGDGSAESSADRATITAELTGASGLVKQDVGTLILTGTNSYTGGTIIAAGTLQLGDGGTSGSIAGNIENQSALIFNRSNLYDFAGTISGTGTLTQAGAGTLRLGGIHSYTGDTIVAAGTLEVDGSIAGSATFVGAAGTLSGTGTVGSTRIAGSIAPGNSIGTLDVAGNYTQLAGSTYSVELAASGTADLIRISGSADLLGGTVEVANPSGQYYMLGGRSLILTAAGGIGGPGFAAVAPASPLTQPFLTLGLGYDANNVYLGAVRNGVAFEAAGDTPNQRAVAGGADDLAEQDPLYIAVASVRDAAAAGQAFDALSGEIHATVRGILLDESRYLREAASARLREASGERGQSRGGLWGRAIAAGGEFDGDGNAAAADRSTTILFIGADANLGSGWRVGLIGGYGRSTIHVDSRSSSASVDSYHAGAFAGGSWGGTSLRVGGAMTWHDLATRRGTGFDGFSGQANADYDARTTQFFAEAGQAIALGGASIEPFAALAHVWVDNEGFVEDGGASALTGEKEKEQITLATLGLRATARFAAGLDLNGSVAWHHALGGRLPEAQLGFGGNAPFTVAGPQTDRDALGLDLGAALAIGSAAVVSVGYSGRMGAETRDHAARVGLTVAF